MLLQVDENNSSAKSIIYDVRGHSTFIMCTRVYACVIEGNMNKPVEIDNKRALMGC